LAKGDITRRGVHLGTPFGGREGRRLVEVNNGAIRKSAGRFLQALHCDHCTIFNHSAVKCLQR